MHLSRPVWEALSSGPKCSSRSSDGVPLSGVEGRIDGILGIALSDGFGPNAEVVSSSSSTPPENFE